MKEDYLKALEKVTSFFPSHLVPFNGQNCKKQKEPRTSARLSSGYKTTSEKFLVVVYYLTKFDDVI